MLLLFTLLQTYMATTREALINAENNLTQDKLALKKLDYDLTKYITYIKSKTRIIHSTGNSISSQHMVIIFEEVASDVLPSDMRTTDEPLYRAWRTKTGPSSTSTELIEVLEKADAIVQPLAGEEYHDPQGHREKAAELQNTVVELHRCFLIWISF